MGNSKPTLSNVNYQPLPALGLPPISNFTHTHTRELSPAPGKICSLPSTPPSRSTLSPAVYLWSGGQGWVEAGTGESVRMGEAA